MAYQLLKKDKQKIENMNKTKLGNYIFKVNPKSNKFKYAVSTFKKKYR